MRLVKKLNMQETVKVKSFGAVEPLLTEVEKFGTSQLYALDDDSDSESPLFSSQLIVVCDLEQQDLDAWRVKTMIDQTTQAIEKRAKRKGMISKPRFVLYTRMKITQSMRLEAIQLGVNFINRTIDKGVLEKLLSQGEGA